MFHRFISYSMTDFSPLLEDRGADVIREDSHAR